MACLGLRLRGLKVLLRFKKPVFFFKKGSRLVKKIKSTFKGLKSLKMVKKHFDKSLKMKLLPKSFFLA
jgi:hypothetical protein